MKKDFYTKQLDVKCQTGILMLAGGLEWFGTFFIFPYIGNNRPNLPFFFRGVETTNRI